MNSFIFCAVIGFANQQAAAESDQWTECDSPQLAVAIEEWKASAKMVDYLKAKLTRTTFNDANKKIKVSEGNVLVDGKHGVRCSLSLIQGTSKSDLLNCLASCISLAGDGYWIVTPKMIYDIDHKDHSIRAVAVRGPADFLNDQRAATSVNSSASVVPSYCQPFVLVSPNAVDSLLNDFDISMRKSDDQNLFELLCVPKTQAASDNYSRLDFLFDAGNALPTGVRWIDPGKATRTIFRLSDIKINYPEPPRRQDFEVELAYEFQKFGAVRDEVDEGMVPNLVGLAHNVATEKLKAVGCTQSQIVKRRAGPAPKPDQKWHVATQSIKPGSQISEYSEVVLRIFTLPVEN